ncbi:MAG: hypothetical protein IJF97_00780 [Eggerthellaceae bacterium]|nr:hypothetical protein [Eggerthellaceae bacterium]MBQ3342673.1 hypothetical protein [Kiritimatiellia bacterium]MBQ9621580.1 hypothetical protein [Atopobiaceae bacterium]
MALKRLGFSMEEIRRMSMGAFVAYTDIALGPDGQSRPEAVRDATQADIDRLLG